MRTVVDDAVIFAREVRLAILFSFVALVGVACGGEPPTKPATPASIAIVGSSERTGNAGTSVLDPLVVQVRDAEGRAVAGVSVAWRVAFGSGTLSATSPVTDNLGRASSSFTLRTTIGVDSVEASVTTASVSPAHFALNAVVGPVASLTVTPLTISIQVGQNRGFAIQAKDAFANAVSGVVATWVSSAPTIASVSPSGVVTGLLPGTATITATIQTVSAAAQVIVVPGNPVKLDVQTGKPALVAGDTSQLALTARDSAGNLFAPSGVTWVSSAPTVATVSATGVVTAVSFGTVTITGTVGVVSGAVTITVSENIGIFSETSPRLRPDFEAFFGTFAGSGATFTEFRLDSTTKVEGSASLRMTVRSLGTGFVGWYVAWGDSAHYADDRHTRDMSKYARGSFRFWAMSSVDLEVGIRSGNVLAGDEISKTLASRVGFAIGGGWKQLCVPLAQLTGPKPLADLSQMKILFVVAVSQTSGGTGGNAVTFFIDDVRWDTLSC